MQLVLTAEEIISLVKNNGVITVVSKINEEEKSYFADHIKVDAIKGLLNGGPIPISSAIELINNIGNIVNDVKVWNAKR